jgi:signal transduction histidine kinase
MGSGLYLSRGLAELMHGSLILESTEVGDGSTFSLSLPHALRSGQAPFCQIA